MPHNIEIVPFESYHLDLMVPSKEQEYIFTLFKEKGISIEQYGQLLKDTAVDVNGQPCAWTYYCDGEVYGCGGIVQTAIPHIAECWCIFSDKFRTVFKTAVKRIRKAVNECQYNRIQAVTEIDFPEGQRLLEFLGFEKEGVLRKQGFDKRDNIMYSIIKD